jgi:hypothetical protein
MDLIVTPARWPNRTKVKASFPCENHLIRVNRNRTSSVVAGLEDHNHILETAVTCFFNDFGALK